MEAVIVADPTATPVTNPEASTVATDWSLDDHENCTPATTRPFASNAWADRLRVAPTATESVDGDTVTETGTAGTNTEISAEPETPSVVAVIVAAPSATPVTNPEASTVATDWSLDDHENCTPATTRPFASNACADRFRVAPTATEPVEGDTVTETGTAGADTETVANPETPPVDAVTVAVPSATPVTRPEAFTVATDWSLDDHEN